jgi:hypothetical protein
MILVGIVVTFLGFIISLMSLGMASGVGARMAMVLVGIVVSLVGIFGVINKAYVNDAIWKK